MRAFALFSLVLAAPVFAQTVYSWEDDEGVHFTDDVNQVPRAQVKVETQRFEKAATTNGLTAPAPTAPTPAPAPSNERAWRERFVEVHRRADTLRRTIASLNKSLPPRTECVPQLAVVGTNTPVPPTLAPVQQPVRTGQAGVVVVPPATRCQLNPEHDRLRVEIAAREVELRDAELDLEYLERVASQSGVPREWRRGW